MKRVVSTILCVIMIFLLIPNFALAETTYDSVEIENVKNASVSLDGDSVDFNFNGIEHNTIIANRIKTIIEPYLDRSKDFSEIKITTIDTSIQPSRMNTPTITLGAATVLTGTYREKLNQLAGIQGSSTTYYWNAGRSHSQLISDITRGDYTSCLTKTACVDHTNNCTSNEFDLRYQCNGYAQYVAYALTGTIRPGFTNNSGAIKTQNYSNGWSVTVWDQVNKVPLNFNSFIFEPGDVVSYYNGNAYGGLHYAVIWYVSGNNIYVAHANAGGRCKIVYGLLSSTELTAMKSNLRWVAKAPGNTKVPSITPTSCSHSYSSTGKCTKCGFVLIKFDLYSAKQSIGSTNATIARTISVNEIAISSVTSVGFMLCDAQGNQLKDASGNNIKKMETPIPSGSVINAWYNINTELNYILKPSTRYYFKFLALVNGSLYDSGVQYFDTASVPVNVSFNANGGSNTPNSITVNTGGAYGNLPTVTRNGYSFAGWYTAQTGGSKITSSTTVTNASNHTLYAQWTQSSLTLSFNANGGSVSTNSKTVTCGSTYGTLPTPSRTGYTFNGWFTAQSGGSRVTTSTIVSNTANHTLYAQWTQNSTTITVGNIERLSANRASSTSIKLTWRKALNATGYHIFRSTSATGTYVYIKTIYTSPYSYMIFTNTGLVKGKTYYYQVRAFNKAGTTVTKGAMSSYVYAKTY